MSDDIQIGGMHADLGIDGRDWFDGLEDARDALASFAQEVGNQLKALESTFVKVGAAMTAAITVPFAGLVGTSVKGAASFEAAMNKVQAAVGRVDAGTLERLSAAAQSLGPGVGKNAIEAAEGIETLALAGMSADDVLQGGLAAALKLAGANAADMAAAGAAVTDVMSQFKLTVDDLPMVVDRITGGLDNSKLGFEDFQLAIAQAGGVAGAAGVSFEDFNTSIAGTAALFGSGSDAGTSFKTFITALVGNSKDAREEIEALGLSFWDAKDNLKPMAEIAGELDRALNGLSGKRTSEALSTIFGTDAMRTAIGLADLGRKGFQDMQAAIARADAGEKLAIQMQGAEAAMNRLSIAFLNLKIAIGNTGLLDAFTSIIDSIASAVQWFAELHPAILSIGLALGGLAALLGPIALLLGTIGGFVIARIAAGFGLMGQVLAFIISPMSTLVELLGGFLAQMGLMRIVGVLGTMLGRLVAPVGLVVAAFTILKDAVVPTLSILWDRAVAVLGPPMLALFEALGNVFSKISGGPIGAALNWIIDLIAKLTEVVGTFVALLLRIGGEIVIRALAGIIEAIGSVVEMIGGMVDAVNQLLSGDFAGAWESALGVIESFAHGFANVMGAMVPEASGFFEQLYQSGKAWLADGFTDIGSWLSKAVSDMATAVSTAFPRVVAAAKSVYEGVKNWLVDSFGPLIEWVKGAAQWIGDQYDALRKRLGLGVDQKPSNSGDAPKPPAAAKSTAFNGGSAPADAGSGKKGRSSNVIDLAARREMMKLQQQLAVARARDDVDEVRRIQDIIDLKRRENEYEQAGLDKAAAKVAAAADMKELLAAEAVHNARQVSLDEDAFDLQLAEMRNDYAQIEALRKKEFLEQRINVWKRDNVSLAEAEARAAQDLAQIEAARAERRRQQAEADARDREADLARLRGESDATIRRIEMRNEVERRAERIADRGGISLDKAREQAMSEVSEEELARQQGQWRDTIKDAWRAALDGDLGSFAKNWLKDSASRGLEEALNSLSDVLFNLFRQALGQAGGATGGGGGWFSNALSGIGSIFAGAGGPMTGVSVSSQSYLDGMSASLAVPKNLPGFATGGSFEIGGAPGIDTNLVQFWGTAGETVNIKRGGNDNEGGGNSYHFSGNLLTPEWWAMIDAKDSATGAQAVGTTERRASRRAKRRMGR